MVKGRALAMMSVTSRCPTRLMPKSHWAMLAMRSPKSPPARVALLGQAGVVQVEAPDSASSIAGVGVRSPNRPGLGCRSAGCRRRDVVQQEHRAEHGRDELKHPPDDISPRSGLLSTCTPVATTTSGSPPPPVWTFCQLGGNITAASASSSQSASEILFQTKVSTFSLWSAAILPHHMGRQEVLADEVLGLLVLRDGAGQVGGRVTPSLISLSNAGLE